MSRRKAGFTLIELITTVAIVGILAAIAWPQYERQRMKNRRSEAISALLVAQNEMEKCYSKNGAYLDTCLQTTESIDGNYEIAVTIVTDADIEPVELQGVGYSLEATPAADSSQMADTDCASFTIANTGSKSATNQSCWAE